MCPSADIAAPQSATASSSLAALLAGLRVRQWAKNLLLFAGLLFAAKLGDGSRWLEAGAAFVAYCSASSAAYLFNDVRDVQEDRLHPTKSRRPIASGSLSASVALYTAAFLLALAGIAALLGTASLGFLLGFAALQLAYSLVLKRLAFVDALAIAGLFVLRAAAGAEAVSVRISVWLLVCTALLALFLALAKRRAELLLVHTKAAPGRAALSAYSSRLLDRLVLATAVSATVTYSVYAFTTHDSFELAATIPFVAFAITRYVHLVVRDGVGEEPERVLLGDVPILTAAAAWALTCGLTLSVW